MSDNVLDFIARDENSITRLLVALCRLKPVRDAFVKVLTHGDVSGDSVEADDINDQLHTEYGKPDIEVRSTDFYALIEVKTSLYTPLQPSQPNRYLEHILKKEGNYKDFFLIFLLPNLYITDKINAEHRKFIELHKGKNIKLNIVYWDRLIAEFHRAGLVKSIPYVRDFCETLENYFNPPRISFSSEQLRSQDMFSRESAEAISNVFALIHNLKEKFEKNGFEIEASFKRNWWKNEEYGFYIKIDEEKDQHLWFGLWMPFWQKTGAVLCMSINQDCSPEFISIFKKTLIHTQDFEKCCVFTIERGRLENNPSENIYNLITQILDENNKITALR